MPCGPVTRALPALRSSVQPALAGLLAVNGSIAIALAGAGGGAAATVGVDRGEVYVAADSGEANVVTVSASGTTVTVTHAGGSLTVEAGCVLTVPGSTAVCSAPAPLALEVGLGDGDDRATIAMPAGSFSFVTAGPGTDDVVGGAGDELIRGGDGDDRLDGGGGNDRLEGDAGNDVLRDSGGPGDRDDLDGGPGDDTLNGGPGQTDLYGGPGADLLDGGDGADDTVDYTDATVGVSVTLDGVANDGAAAEGDNVLPSVESAFTGPGPDTIAGSTAANTIDTGAGDDTISGGEGDDRIRSGDGQDGIDGGSGNDSIDGGTGSDTLRGGDGNDELTTAPSDPGADVLDGGGGDDLLAGGSGPDTYGGGAGSDRVDYSARTAPLTVDLDLEAGDDGAPGEGDTVGADVEGIVGGAGADTLTGGPGDDVLNGGPGADAISGLGGIDTVDYSDREDGVAVTLDGLAGDGAPGEGDAVATDVENVRGGSGNDVLAGNDAPNILSGGRGDDVLAGRGGPDTLLGGAGQDDTVSYAERSTPVTVDLGDPGLDGGAEDAPGDTIDADVENVAGGNAADALTGSERGNRLIGGGGADILRGGPATDLADYSDHTVPVTVDLDTQLGDDGAPGEGDTIAADVEGVIGGAGSDVITGNDSYNLLFAGPGDDAVLAGDGVPDEIDCGPGSDSLTADDRDVHAGCERVDVREPAASGDRDGLTEARPPGTIGTVGSLSLAKGALAVTVRCAANARGGCRVRIVAALMPRAALTVGSATVRLAPRARRTLAIALRGRGLATLRASGRGTARLTLTITERSGPAASRRSLTVRRTLPLEVDERGAPVAVTKRARARAAA